MSTRILLSLVKTLLSLAWVLGGSLLVVIPSIAEHADLLTYLLAGALLVIGFWLRSWKVELERRVLRLEERASANAQALAALAHVPAMLDDHLREERQFQRFVYEHLGNLTKHLTKHEEEEEEHA